MNDTNQNRNQQRQESNTYTRRPTKAEMIARKKRNRRIRRIKHGITLAICTLIVCFAILNIAQFFIEKIRSNEQEEIVSKSVVQESGFVPIETTQSKSLRESESIKESEIQQSDEEALSYEEKLAIIQENSDSYPAELIRCVKNYPETIDFVYQYHQNIQQEFDMQLTKEDVEGEIPLLLQWDKRWGYTMYGGSFLGVDGCGPTCVSMVYIALTGDTKKNPYVIAKFSEKNGYYIEGYGSSWTLMTDGVQQLGLQSKVLILMESTIKEELDAEHYVICSMGSGDFTNSGHFIVLVGYTEEGFKIHDPNSKVNSEKIWSYERISPQIKNLWSISN